MTNKMKPVFYVDLPVPAKLGEDDDSWLNVGNFDSMEEALEFVRTNIGNCDDEGKLRIITEGETWDCEGEEAEEESFAPDTTTDIAVSGPDSPVGTDSRSVPQTPEHS